MAASSVIGCQTTTWAPQVMKTTQLIRAQQRHIGRRRQKAFGSAPSRRTAIINQRAYTFTYRTSDNVPLHHLPGAPADWFEEYMEDKGRIVGAIIPEKSSALRLNQEEWRITMPVIEALFLKAQPVIDIRVATKSNGQDYPPHVPPHITKLYETHTTKWELQGLHSDYMPPFFNIEASGTLYPLTHATDHRGCIIKNQLKANITIAFPPLLAWVPHHVLDNIVHSIIRTIVEDIKKGYTVRLLADYRSFQRSKLKNST
ncbi:uncharacterized protein LOC129307351 isoform X2 [Prosopis cineraria]|uniref:uncharacterized protein LOC129307351 isoform X2 n=1 Tax=Prosopis cineraria TaxID=364024 RepID=UPI00240FF242|nr:uncharacterized protein LOC129307351 isoform X2 [Prosopis cineraria]